MSHCDSCGSLLPSIPFAESALPEHIPNPTVTFHRHTLIQFNVEYRRMMEFMAYVLGLPIERVAPADVGAWALRNFDRLPDGLPMWIRQEAVWLSSLRQVTGE